MENKIQIYGEPLREVLSQVPKWFYRFGTVIILTVLCLLFLIAYFIKYPDVIVAEVRITSESSPVELVANNPGRIESVHVENGHLVEKGDLIATLSSNAKFQDVLLLDKTLAYFKYNDPDFDLPINLTLGAIQNSYSFFNRKLKEYRLVKEFDPDSIQIALIEVQIEKLNFLLDNQKAQNEAFLDEINLQLIEFERSRKLFQNNVISERKFEEKKLDYLESKRYLLSLKEKISSTNVQINNLEKEKEMLALNRTINIKNLEIELFESQTNLVDAVHNWKIKHLIESPNKGKVVFFDYWSKGQYVKEQEELFNIVPTDSSRIIGRVKMPLKNSGKVKIGQSVIVKLENFPYSEFGSLIGTINSKSLVPKESYYYLEIVFPNGSITTSGKNLPFLQEMEGSAEIITEDLRLSERIFYELNKIVSSFG